MVPTAKSVYIEGFDINKQVYKESCAWTMWKFDEM